MTNAIFFFSLIIQILNNNMPSCGCKKPVETFFKYAKQDKNGIVALIEVIDIKTIKLNLDSNRLYKPIPIQYYEVRVIKNLGKRFPKDTIKILVPSGVDCCLSNLINNKKGDSSIIHAMEWDESNYGYDNDEIHVFALNNCMISNLRIYDSNVIGPITRKKIQSMPLIKVMNKFH